MFFSKVMRSSALDESSLSIGRVKPQIKGYCSIRYSSGRLERGLRGAEFTPTWNTNQLGYTTVEIYAVKFTKFLCRQVTKGQHANQKCSNLNRLITAALDIGHLRLRLTERSENFSEVIRNFHLNY